MLLKEEITLSVHVTNALKHKDNTIDDNTNNNTKVLAKEVGTVLGFKIGYDEWVSAGRLGA